MLSKPRRCPECDYTWSRYLAYHACPHCSVAIDEAEIRREIARIRLLQIPLFVIGGLMGLLILVWAFLYG
jgi:hypothetical protein